MDLTTILSVGAAMIMALVAVGSFIYKLGQPKDHKKDPLSEISEENKVLKTKQEALEKELDNLTTSLVQESERTDREVDRLYKKIDDLSVMIMKVITDSFK